MFDYIVLGIVQGLTEFLPVSSSGHLVVLQKIMGFETGQVALSVVLHLGTLLAVVVFFRKDLFILINDRRRLFYILITVFITAAVALAAKDFFEGLFSSPRAVAIAWMATGIILILTRSFMRAERKELRAKDAVVMGLAQAAAIVPGLSRSGLTISALLFRRLKPELAFSFSFLASIPVILGATLLEARDIQSLAAGSSGNLAAGFGFSFAAGIFSLWLLKSAIRRCKFHYFGYYCILASLFTMIFFK